MMSAMYFPIKNFATADVKFADSLFKNARHFAPLLHFSGLTGQTKNIPQQGYMHTEFNRLLEP